MLRDASDRDLETFSFAGTGEREASSIVDIQGGAMGATATIPDAHLLFNSDFVRAGHDLILRGHDGGSAFVRDYFASDERATLMSPDGAKLSGSLVEAMSGSLAPNQYAQAGAPTPAASDAVGRVVTSSGDASIIRNGVAVTLNPGDPVLRADVLQTQAGTMAVTFNDGSTLNLTANTRIVVSEFVYSPNGAGNSQLLDLVQGSLTFISGEVAHSGNMRIGTPVATMGIRGTVGGVTTANDGTVHFYVSQSATGAVIINEQGQIIANVVQDGPLIVVRPVGPLQVVAEEIQKTPAQLALELQALQQIVSIKAVGDQLLQQFFQQQNPNDPNPQSPQDQPHTQIQINLHYTGNNGIVGDLPGGDTPRPFDLATVNFLSPNPETPPTPTDVTDLLQVNLPPVTFAPLAAALSEDQTLAFNGSKAISVHDADSAVVTLTLSVTHGILSLAGVAGLTFAAGHGASGATMTFSGSPAAINAALHGMVFTPHADFNGAASLTITTDDGNSPAVTTTVPIAVTAVNDAPVVTPASATVSEEGLGGAISDAAGTGDTTNSAVAHGTMSATDVDHDTLTYKLGLPSAELTSDGVPVNWSLCEDGTLEGSACGNTVISVTLDKNTGAYTVSLLGPIDHPNGGVEDALSFDIPVAVDDGTVTTNGYLGVTVEDDSPKAADIETTATADSNQGYSTAFVLDFSGSIDDSELNTMLNAVKSAGNAIFEDASGPVAISVIIFSSTADSLGTFTSFSGFQAAIDAVNPNIENGQRPLNGGTDFDAALQATMSSFAPSDSAHNQVFFLSDGQSSLTEQTAQAWTVFVTEHDIAVTTVKIGDGVSESGLQAIEVDGGSPIAVQDFDGLVEALLNAVGSGTTRNIFTDGEATVGFGADGGRIESVTIEGVTYTWDGDHTVTSNSQGQWTQTAASFTVTTALGGVLTFYFGNESDHAAGDWIYTPPVAASSNEIFHYTLVDTDGDGSVADITVNLGAPEFDAAGVTTVSPDSLHTLVAGLAVADGNAGSSPLTFSVTGLNGTFAFDGDTDDLGVSGSGTHALTATGTLSAINAALASGIVYTDDGPQPPTSSALATINDGHGGADTVNFVFTAATPTGPVTLTGTSDKDIIFSAGPAATLTGNGGSDTFVFAIDNGGIAHITDFNIADDFLQISHTLFASVDALLEQAHDDGNGNTVITTAAQGSLVLNSVDATTFQSIDHSHIIIV